MFRKILTILTLVLVIFVVWSAWPDIRAAFDYLANTNLFFIILLIPEQLFMYYCVGQMFFSYMAAKGRTEKLHHHHHNHKTKTHTTKVVVDSAVQKPEKDCKVAPRKLSAWALARISFELNFVNHAIPSGGFAGLGYIAWRLKDYGSSFGQTSFMYALRYAITILSNQAQTIIAIIVLVAIQAVPKDGWWVVGLVLLVSLGIAGGLALLIVIASSKKRIKWFAKISTNAINATVKFVTFGHKKHIIKYEDVEKFLLDIYKDLMVARRDKKVLIPPIMWGVVYSFLEIATYWLVGISMGHPEILPQIMVAEALASVIGAVMLTPGGVGGYEATMIFIMATLGVDLGLATAVVITTRVIVLVGTIVSGYGFYQNAISKIGKKEQAKIMKEAEGR